MWASLLAGLLARPWARRAAALALVALAITMFILNLRRQGERVGRAAERLETLERNDAIHRQMLDAAAHRTPHAQSQSGLVLRRPVAQFYSGVDTWNVCMKN